MHRHHPIALNNMRLMLVIVAASSIALYSFFSFEPTHNNLFTTPVCNAACLSHSQAGLAHANVHKFKKNDNEPRPPAVSYYDRPFTVPLLFVALTAAFFGWLNWYNRRMLTSTQLRY